MDVAGNLQLTKAGLERFRTNNPDLVSGITYTQAPSPELPGKRKAQQAAGRMDIDLVLAGPGVQIVRDELGRTVMFGDEALKRSVPPVARPD